MSFKTYIQALLAGALLPLAFAPVSIYPLAIISPAVIFHLYLSASPRQAIKLGYTFGIGFFGVGVSWVYVAFHDFGFTSVGLSVLMTAMFVLVLATCQTLQAYTAVKLSARIKNKKYFLILSLLLVYPLCWVLFEWIRGWIFTGFPWLNLGYSQVDSSLSGYASMFGVYGVSWVSAILAGLLVLFFMTPQKRIGIAVTFIVLWLSGFLLNKVEWTHPVDEPIKVSLVQGNVPQITKWDPAAIQKRLDTYADLTREHWDSDVVIWPENAMTTFYNDLVDGYFKPLVAEAQKNKTDLIVGTPVMDDDGQRYYSSMVSLGKKEIIYNKRHLVPFGEFIPLQDILRGVISFFDLPMSGFSPGEKIQAPLEAAGQFFAPSICYEDAFGEELIDFLPQSTILVNGSNNAWYGNSFAPHQHLQISQMRSLETGRMMVRTTTNGISAIIDHKGNILKRSPQFETHVITGFVQPRRGSTPYVKHGNWGFTVWMFLLLGIFAFHNRGHRGTQS